MKAALVRSTTQASMAPNRSATTELPTAKTTEFMLLVKSLGSWISRR